MSSRASFMNYSAKKKNQKKTLDITNTSLLPSFDNNNEDNKHSFFNKALTNSTQPKNAVEIKQP